MTEEKKETNKQEKPTKKQIQEFNYEKKESKHVTKQMVSPEIEVVQPKKKDK